MKEGTGRLSPRKNDTPIESDAYDPFGRPGAGAPPKDPTQARRHKPEAIEGGNGSSYAEAAARRKFLKEQQELMVLKQQEVDWAKEKERERDRDGRTETERVCVYVWKIDRQTDRQIDEWKTVYEQITLKV